MKRKLLLFAGIMFSAVCVTFGQADTTKDQQSKAGRTQSPASTQHMGPENYIKDMTRVKATDVPPNLKSTLQGTEYKGWEKGNLYKTKNGESYILEMNKGGQKEYHRFGPDGKIMPNPKDN